MLVQYTSLAELQPAELQALKNAIRGLTLEGRGTHFQFAGKTFMMSELINAQRMWESERRSPGQQLNG